MRKRSRRSAEDMKPRMKEYRNAFYDWLYAGNKDSMIEICADNEVLREGLAFSKAMDYDYFAEIPDDCFYDVSIAKKYGENLKKIRKEKGWTLEEAAEILKISFQNLQQIEEGPRKRIDRNLLLLVCAVYQKSPEELMGLSAQSTKRPMIFYSETIAKEASYVVDCLIYGNISLLDAFAFFAKSPISIRNKLLCFLRSVPAIQTLTAKQIKETLNRQSEPVIPQSDDKVIVKRYDWNFYYGRLGDMGMETPELLGVYVSIAAEKTIWEKVLKLISYADFFPLHTE